MSEQLPSPFVQVSVAAPVLKTRELDELIAFAETFKVQDALTEQLASEELNAAKQFRAAVELQRVQTKAPILEAGRRIDALFNPARDRAEYARKLLAAELARYDEEKERKRRELEAKARAAARAEQERLAREVAELEGRGRQGAAKLLEEAAAQEQAGNVTAAAELKKRAEQAQMGAQQDAQLLLERGQQVIPLPLPEAPKPTGYQSRKLWAWEGVSLDETVKAACPICNPIAGPRVAKALAWNEGWLSATATALGEELSVPGVRVFQRTVIAATGGKG